MLKKLPVISLPLFIFAVGCIYINMTLVRFAYSNAIYVISTSSLLITLFIKYKITYRISLCILYLFLFIKLSFLINFKSYLSLDSFVMLYDTNLSEASEFLDNYFSPPIITLIITLSISLIIPFNDGKSLHKRLIYIPILLITCIIHITPRLRTHHLIYNTIDGYNKYKC